MSNDLKNVIEMVFENWEDYYTADYDSKDNYNDAVREVVKSILKSFDTGYVYPYIGIFFQDDGQGWVEINFNYNDLANGLFPVISEIYQMLKEFYNVKVDYPQDVVDKYGCYTNDGWVITIKKQAQK